MLVLPKVDVEKPAKVIGTDTVGAMQSGIYWGYISLIEGILQRLTDEFDGEGGEIKSVREFFDYCMLYLTCQSDLKVEQVANTSFTSSRRFYLLEAEELARFRANAEQVTTWSGARKCHFFWAGMEKDEVGRKWVGCACAFCLEENFDKCARRHLFIVDGVDYNAPTVARLEAKAPTARTRAEEIAASLKVYMILYDC